MIKKTILISFTVFNCIFAPIASGQEPVIPGSVSALKQQLEKEMKNRHVVGMMFTLVTKDSVLYAGGLGFANLEKKIPVNGNHLVIVYFEFSKRR